jgi:hypothetical protein
VPFSTTPSPLHSGQVFMLAPHGMLPQPRDYIRAVLRLIASSYLVGAWTGMSALLQVC